MPITTAAYELVVAPKLSQFTQCNMQDMKSTYKQSEHWISNYVLNFLFRAKLNGKSHLYVFNQLRRSYLAFTEYDNAKISLENYLGKLNNGTPNILLYLEGLSHLEIFMSQAYQALFMAKRFLEDNGMHWNAELFENENELYFTKLKHFHTYSKHLDEKIQKGFHLESGGIAMWITNSGLEYKRETTQEIWCFEWCEMETILSDLAECAQLMVDTLAQQCIPESTAP